MAEASRKPAGPADYGEYCSWPDDERCELINGVVYDMTPAPTKQHADVLSELFFAFKNFFSDKSCKVYVAPFDVRLPESDEPDDLIKTVVQPDILVVCDPKKLDQKGCRGAPDLVIEILSPSTAAKDCIIKCAIYEKHGVKEFWTVDPINRLITVYVLSDAGFFGKPQMFDDQANIKVSMFEGLEIDAAKIFPFQPRVVKEDPETYTRI